MKQFLTVLLAGLWLAAVPAGAAQPSAAYDRVSFQLDLDREVANDHAEAVLSVTDEDRNPAELASRINSAMRWALDMALAEKQVKVQSGSYRTYPVYDDKKIVRWRGRQDLVLESGDVDALSRLVGRLQTRLQMQSLRFSVAPDTRRKVEDGLIEQVLAAFEARAARIATALGARGYRIVRIDLGTSGRPPVLPVRMESARRLTAAAVPPPAMESGTSRIGVQLSGTIELRRKRAQ
ncbi:MAG TPA: DUF541 domain-containing protein [Gammaproteobacteria bacterium]|nr:DUF541 domain-containing protein [Gammaproteobacteria bacterium]